MKKELFLLALCLCCLCGCENEPKKGESVSPTKTQPVSVFLLPTNTPKADVGMSPSSEPNPSPTMTIASTPKPSPKATNTPTEVKDAVESSADWFLWEDTSITGLTDIGKEQPEIRVPKKCTEIKKEAFANTNIERISFANPDTLIGEGAFKNCEFLVELQLPKNISAVPVECASGAINLTTVVLPEKATIIEAMAFQNCASLSSVLWGTKIEKIMSFAFDNCISLESLSFTNIQSIEGYAFHYCNGLISVVFGETLESLGSGAFAHCESLSSIVLPESCWYLGLNVFADCPITEIYLPRNLTILEDEQGNIDADFFYQETASVYVHRNSNTDTWLTEKIFSLAKCRCEKKYY